MRSGAGNSKRWKTRTRVVRVTRGAHLSEAAMNTMENNRHRAQSWFRTRAAPSFHQQVPHRRNSGSHCVSQQWNPSRTIARVDAINNADRNRLALSVPSKIKGSSWRMLWFGKTDATTRIGLMTMFRAFSVIEGRCQCLADILGPNAFPSQLSVLVSSVLEYSPYEIKILNRTYMCVHHRRDDHVNATRFFLARQITGPTRRADGPVCQIPEVFCHASQRKRVKRSGAVLDFVPISEPSLFECTVVKEIAWYGDRQYQYRITQRVPPFSLDEDTQQFDTYPRELIMSTYIDLSKILLLSTGTTSLYYQASSLSQSTASK